MTVHSAKGLEFDAVFITGWKRACSRTRTRCPTRRLEEERRLMYVAITRARKRCT
jgi:DNA helicase-2/ATP-dependent DNA helicase PcrA